MIAMKMRETGDLSPETKFKISANLSISNAAAIKFWFDILGEQDEINPIRDLTLPMLSAMRQVTNNPLDIHIFHKPTLSRIMDAPEMVRVGSPLYLKNARFGPGVGVKERTMMGYRVVENIRRYLPEAKQSKPFAKGLNVTKKV